MFSSLFAASRKKDVVKDVLMSQLIFITLCYFLHFSEANKTRRRRGLEQAPGRAAFGDITKGCVFPQQAARVFLSTRILAVEADRGKRPFVMS